MCYYKIKTLCIILISIFSIVCYDARLPKGKDYFSDRCNWFLSKRYYMTKFVIYWSSIQKNHYILLSLNLSFCAVFIEKILRIQPEIQKLYLLVRASSTDLAEHRLQKEVHHPSSSIYIKIVNVWLIKEC